MNVAFALSLHAMARLSGDATWAAKARRVERALLERCLDERTGLFFDLAGRARAAGARLDVVGAVAARAARPAGATCAAGSSTSTCSTSAATARRSASRR